MSNDVSRGRPRIQIQELVTRADAPNRAVLRARVRGTLGPYLVYRLVILLLATVTCWILGVRDALLRNGGGAVLLGLMALGLSVIVALIVYELVRGQPIHVVATDLRAIGGRVPVAELDDFEISLDGARADLRAVRCDGRRVDVALGIEPGDARALIALIERVVPVRRSSPPA